MILSWVGAVLKGAWLMTSSMVKEHCSKVDCSLFAISTLTPGKTVHLRSAPNELCYYSMVFFISMMMDPRANLVHSDGAIHQAPVTKQCEILMNVFVYNIFYCCDEILLLSALKVDRYV